MPFTYRHDVKLPDCELTRFERLGWWGRPPYQLRSGP